MSLYRSEYVGSGPAAALFDAFVRLYVRPRVYGREHLPKEGPFILAANHASHADTAVIFTALPYRLRHRVLAAAARDYFFDNKLRRASARMLFNAVPVDRHPVPGRDPLRHPIRALRQGYGLLIYPEGTRSPNGEVQRFRSGIGKLVSLFPEIPVVPIWLETAHVMPKGAIAPAPRAVEVRFGEPLRLTAKPDDRASWQAVAEEVRAAVLRLRDEHEAAEAPKKPQVPVEPAAEESAATQENRANWRSRLRWPWRRNSSTDETAPEQ